MSKYANDDPSKCPCLCHDPKTRFLPSEFIPCCAEMGTKRRSAPELEDQPFGTDFGNDNICDECSSTGTDDNGQLCKSCNGKGYR